MEGSAAQPAQRILLAHARLARADFPFSTLDLASVGSVPLAARGLMARA
jgi:hypothetical protein